MGNLLKLKTDNPISNRTMPKIIDLPQETRSFDIRVKGLPLNSGDQEAINAAIQDLAKDGKLETDLVSDGYHTFKELYDHRIQLYISLANVIQEVFEQADTIASPVWKSRLHSDGSSMEGWFVMGIGYEKGSQITYHLPEDRWNDCKALELNAAPEFDGHSSYEVLQRLKEL